jgi:hypothetical protein
LPIFGEPPEALDEDWTHGALIGGMSGWWSEQQLAESYFLAADHLIATVLAGKERGQDLWGPIMYLYRHGIELFLKLIVQPAKQDHNLGALLEGFCAHIRSRYREKVPSWITRPISELAQIDPRSDLFRYRETKPIETAARLANRGEFWVDLRAIRKEMTRLLDAFQRVVIADETGEILPARRLATLDDD